MNPRIQKQSINANIFGSKTFGSIIYAYMQEVKDDAAIRLPEEKELHLYLYTQNDTH